MRAKLAACCILTVLLGVFAVMPLQAQTPLFRLTANFDGPAEKSASGAAGLATAGGGGGTVIYSRAIFQPPGKNTIFVTFSGTGDSHSGSTLAMSCKVDGAPCAGMGVALGACAGAPGAPAGWICLSHMPNGGANGTCNNGGGGPGDCHDNNINQTFCKTVAPGAHIVELKIARVDGSGSPDPGNTVFIEGGKYYIDSTNFTDDNPDNCSKNPGT